MKKKLSIIIPVLNEINQLETSVLGLEEWLQITWVEVIWVDGGSSDGTADWLSTKGFNVLEAPKGRANQMNAGAQHAAGDLLMFLHVDTLLPKTAMGLDLPVEEFIQFILDTLFKTKKVWGRFDVEILGSSKMLKLIAWFMNKRSRLSGIATGDQTLFMVREAFDRLGGFPDQPLMEDIEMSKRLKTFSAPLCLEQKVKTSGRRWEARGIWSTILLMWKLRFLYWYGVPTETIADMYK